MNRNSAAIRRLAGSSLVTGLCVAAAAAVLALLTLSSIGFAAFDTLAVILRLAELVDHIDEPWPWSFGAELVLLVLTSILPSSQRRMQRAATPAPSTNGSAAGTAVFLASAVIQVADRIDALNSDLGNGAPEMQIEANRLRSLAQSVEN